ncbi:macrophage erythroblast attacher-like protein [Dermatophagoides farinae]|uniref:E3 ubiquitin-protein transferase MAEA n=1 Tax=Dermatophagoides farinae TaxID=6954 RepID=A0A9D4NVF9_DERFA|nr:E3 ubiquitin-protein transferase MAEA-like [Dermatophagoides farinae]KAH7639063.1 macrophage erythroblast attacher-like protein [Dermatophagoides farinae]
MAFSGHPQVVEFFRLVDNNSSVSNNSSLAAAFSRVFARLPHNLFNENRSSGSHGGSSSLIGGGISGNAAINTETFTNSNVQLKLCPTRLATMGTMSDIRALEHQTIKVPYEILNKKFRMAQKNIDREASHVQSSIAELEKMVNQSKDMIADADKDGNDNGNVSNDDHEPVTIGRINELLVGVVNKLSVLKRKSIESITDEINAANVCKRRLDHLKEYYIMNSKQQHQQQQQQQQQLQNNHQQSEPSSTPHAPLLSSSSAPIITNEMDDPVIAQWKRKRMDRMLVDHCLRAGYYETAIQLAECSDIENLTNIDIFLVCKDIESSLARNETARCLAWCHENKSKLRKIKSTLEFSLRQQEFIELIRSEQRVEAVRYAQKYFSNLEDLGGISISNDLLRVMGLLAFQSTTHVEPYKSLFDLNRWQQLIQQFRQENFKLYQLTNASIFSITLQAGLSSLKTPQCYRKDGNRNNECPVCSEGLNKLASSLPCAHCSQSRLVCFITGEPMNENNQPLMLPNGYVYGEKSLRKMADENDGKVTCPRTNESFNFKAIEKVYVM